jgi:putative nucleotidyltransferase with HDIG domain
MVAKESKTKSFIRKLYYVLFFIIALGLIFALYPKKGTFKYEFQRGMPWRHTTLIAPFDFPILKPAEVLEAERDSVMEHYIPYFTLDTAVAISQLTALQNNLNNIFNADSLTVSNEEKEETIAQFVNMYQPVYNNGLLENDIKSYEVLEGKSHIFVIKNNIANRMPVEDIYSLRTAYVEINKKINEYFDEDPAIKNLIRDIKPADFLSANLFFDTNINDQKQKEILSEVSTTRGVIPSGVRIVSEGDMVNSQNYIVLESLRRAYERNRLYGGWASPIVVGQMLLILIIFAGLFLYLQNFNRTVFWKKRNFSMILSVILVMFVLARLVYENNQLDMYLLPVCILPIMIRTFLGARMALYIHIMFVLLLAFLVPNSFEFIFLQIIAGTVAVISLNKLHRRGHLVYTAFFVLLSYVLVFVGFEIMKEGSFLNIQWSELKWFLANAVLLLIAYPLIYIIEKIFGFISDVTLLELADTNNPLLRKLAEIAPGTFQHSMQVANLAEEAIRVIGGNPMLVRAGALYHDIGKIQSSQYFIENLSEGQNPHEKLTHLKSVEKIVGHVTDGVILARKHKLPEPLIDFIKMHHGKGMVKYFYLKYKEDNPGADVKEEDFMYPGPNPDSRETAVVMLADGVEAAARSLNVKNEETLSNIVNQIIDSKVQNKELDNAPITFRDISNIKSLFIEKLKNIYHLRIQYPTEKDK